MLLVFPPHCFSPSLGEGLHGSLTMRASGVEDPREEPTYKELCVPGVLNVVYCGTAYKDCIFIFFKSFYYINFKTYMKVERKYNETPCTHHLASTVINSWPILFLLYLTHSLHLLHYFEVNPRQNNISPMNISFCISKR